MRLKFLHLSDLHFSPSIESDTYSIEQLEAIEAIYSRDVDSFNRVIVTGDLTHDHHRDSFSRANSWLKLKMVSKKGKRIGLSIDDDIKLKVVPGNKDFNVEQLNGEFPGAFFKGLELYNEYFSGSHLFKESKPITYDWFPGDAGVGVFMVYINTSLLGENDSQAKVKARYIDYICEKIRDYFQDGLEGQLKVKRGNADKISTDDFRRSFKILVSHHPLQSKSKKLLSYLSDYSKRTFLSNLGIMDFQIQLSGHDHLHERKEDTYYKIFDARAKNRFVINELKMILGFNDDFSILKSEDGRRFSKYSSILFHALLSLVDPDEKAGNDQDIVAEIERIINGENSTLVENINYLIRKGERRKNLDKNELSRINGFISGLDDERRKAMENNSKQILKSIINSLKKKTITCYNAGSAAVPFTLGGDRHFNIYEIDSNEFGTTFHSEYFQWIPNTSGSGSFVPVGREIFKYSVDKIKIDEADEL